MNTKQNTEIEPVQNNTLCKPKFLSVDEAADFLDIKRTTLVNWVSQKRYPGLKSYKIGAARKFLEEDLIEFINSRKETTSN